MQWSNTTGSTLGLILTCICTLKHYCLPNLQFVGNFCFAFSLFKKLPGDLFTLTRLITLMKLSKLLACCTAGSTSRVSWSRDLTVWSGALPSSAPAAGEQAPRRRLIAIPAAKPSAQVTVQQELIKHSSRAGINMVGMRSCKLCPLMKGQNIYMVFGYVPWADCGAQSSFSI